MARALTMLLASASVMAQQFSFQTFSKAEGLTSLTILSLLEARDGFVWTGTTNGLFRYNGQHFERYGERQGLRESVVTKVVEDPSGRVWALTPTDLYIGGTDGFRPVRLKAKGESAVLGVTSQFELIDENHALIVNKEQLFHLRRSAQDGTWTLAPAFTDAQRREMPALDRIVGLKVLRDGRIWLGCAQALCSVNGTTVKSWGPVAGVTQDRWDSFLISRAGDLWVRSKDHVMVLRPGADAFEPREPPPPKDRGTGIRRPMTEDLSGHILMRNGTSLARWDGARWQSFDQDAGLPDTPVTSLLTDREGGIWLGTSDSGLRRWRGYDAVQAWTKVHGLPPLPVRSIVRDADARLLLGTSSGCRWLDAQTQQLRECPYTGLPSAVLLGLSKDPSSGLWLQFGNGEQWYVPPGSLAARRFGALGWAAGFIFDPSGTCWVTAADKGLFRTNWRDGGPSQPVKVDLPDGVGDVWDTAVDAHGRLFVATSRTLLRRDERQWTRLDVQARDGRATGLQGIRFAPDGSLWAIPISGIGLLRLHGEGLAQRSWIDDPLVEASKVQAIDWDAQGQLWAATYDGLLSLRDGVWRRLSDNDGLPAIGTRSMLLDGESTWLGGSGWLSHVRRPASILNSRTLDVRLIGARYGSMPLRPQGASVAWAADAPLSASFASLSHDLSSRTVYRYRLIGLSDHWSESQTPTLQMPSLSPGEYKLEFMVADLDHARQSAVGTLGFTVSPPWWRTTWFLGTLALVCAAGLALGGRAYLRKLEQQRLELRRQLDERSALLERATRDPLTKLWNRQAILDILERELALVERAATALAVVMVDIDHFKRINDTHGHLAGDAVLREIGSRLSAALRRTDYLGRYGGEELIVVMPGLPLDAGFFQVERLRLSLAESPVAFNGRAIPVTASFGVAWTNNATHSASLLIGHADTALYEAKRGGRNRTMLYLADATAADEASPVRNE